MMKKFITIGAVLVLSLSMLAGCGNSTSNEADTKTENEVIAEQSSEKNEEVAENSEAIAEVVPETETTDVVDEPEDVVETTEEVPENSEAVEEPVAPKTEYTYSALDKTMYAKSSVNVRDLPSTDGERIGGLSARQEVHVTGQCNETNWYRIDYNGETAYVSNSYLVSEKPAEPQPEPEQPKPDTPTECPYELGVWYDMGWYFFKLCPARNEGYMLGENSEYREILLQRYPESANVVAGPASAACESKWNGWWAYYWVAPPLKGSFVFD